MKYYLLSTEWNYIEVLKSHDFIDPVHKGIDAGSLK